MDRHSNEETSAADVRAPLDPRRVSPSSDSGSSNSNSDDSLSPLVVVDTDSPSPSPSPSPPPPSRHRDKHKDNRHNDPRSPHDNKTTATKTTKTKKTSLSPSQASSPSSSSSSIPSFKVKFKTKSKPAASSSSSLSSPSSSSSAAAAAGASAGASAGAGVGVRDSNGDDEQQNIIKKKKKSTKNKNTIDPQRRSNDHDSTKNNNNNKSKSKTHSHPTSTPTAPQYKHNDSVDDDTNYKDKDKDNTLNSKNPTKHIKKDGDTDDIHQQDHDIFKRPLDDPEKEAKVQSIIPQAMTGVQRQFYEHLFRFLLYRGKNGLPPKIPKMGFKELDMYTLFYRIVSEGGFDPASESEGMWIKIFRELPDNFRPTITNASVRLKRYYTRFLLEFEDYFLHEGGGLPGRVVFVVYEPKSQHVSSGSDHNDDQDDNETDNHSDNSSSMTLKDNPIKDKDGDVDMERPDSRRRQPKEQHRSSRRLQNRRSSSSTLSKGQRSVETWDDLQQVMRIHADLYDTSTTRSLLPCMPVVGPAETFGKLWFFYLGEDDTPKITKESDARDVAEAGEIMFWPKEPSVIVGFGATPASHEKEIRLVDQCNAIGRVLPQDLAKLAKVSEDHIIRMEIASPDAAEFGDSPPKPQPQPQSQDPEGDEALEEGHGDRKQERIKTKKKKKKKKKSSSSAKHRHEDDQHHVKSTRSKPIALPDPDTLLQLDTDEQAEEEHKDEHEHVYERESMPPDTQDAAVSTEDRGDRNKRSTQDTTHTNSNVKTSAHPPNGRTNKRTASSAGLDSPSPHRRPKRLRTTTEEHRNNNPAHAATGSSSSRRGGGHAYSLTLKYHEYGENERDANLIKKQVNSREVGLSDIHRFLKEDNVTTDTLSEVRVYEYASDEDGEGWLLLDDEWHCQLHPTHTTRLRLKLKHNRENQEISRS